MKKILRKLKMVSIDVFIYQMREYKPISIQNNFAIEKSFEDGKTCYFIEDNNRIVHKSYLFPNLFLLRAINKKGPAIGDCMTVKSHRGQSLYPYVINNIAKDVLGTKIKEIFVVVNRDNVSSIKGIEKANFTKIASLKAKRCLWFYLEKKITFYN